MYVAIPIALTSSVHKIKTTTSPTPKGNTREILIILSPFNRFSSPCLNTGPYVSAPISSPYYGPSTARFCGIKSSWVVIYAVYMYPDKSLFLGPTLVSAGQDVATFKTGR